MPITASSGLWDLVKRAIIIQSIKRGIFTTCKLGDCEHFRRSTDKYHGRVKITPQLYLQDARAKTHAHIHRRSRSDCFNKISGLGIYGARGY